MPRIIMECVGKIGGVDCYAPADAEAAKAIGDQREFVCDVKGDRAKRTHLQNASIYLYLTNVANALNDAGLDMPAALEAMGGNALVPWSKETALARFWRPIQRAMFGTESTTKLEPAQVSVVYEALNRAMCDKLGVGVPFPDKHSLMDSKQ